MVEADVAQEVAGVLRRHIAERHDGTDAGRCHGHQVGGDDEGDEERADHCVGLEVDDGTAGDEQVFERLEQTKQQTDKKYP